MGRPSSSSSIVGREADTRFSIGPQQRKELEALVVGASGDALADVQLAQVMDKSADVLLIRGRILDVRFEAPTDPKSGAKYLFDAVGQATFVVELIDSDTDDLLLRAIDDRTTDSLERDSASQNVDIGQIASLWRGMLVDSMGYLRAGE